MLSYFSSFLSKPVVLRLYNPTLEDDYGLYLLSNSNPNSLKQAECEIGKRNAVLLYPDPKYVNTQNPTSSRFRYIATIYKNGMSCESVSMGERNYSDVSNPINAKNLIKASLAKVGIGIPIAPLLQTVRPVFQQLTPNLSNSSLSTLTRVSWFANNLAQSILDQNLMTMLKQLLFYIREGNLTEVKNMLRTNPHLAIARWNTENEEEKIMTNMAGQCILIQGKTAYQFALGEGDSEIAAAIKEVIITVADEKEANNQYDAQLPKNHQQKEEEKWKPVFAKLDSLTHAICTAKANVITSSGDPEYKVTVKDGSMVAKELADFRTLLDDMLKKTVTTGRHFNPNLILGLFERFFKYYRDGFGDNWENPKTLLFGLQVIGFGERIMPANWVQAFCDSLNSTIEKLKENIPQSRSFEFYVFHGKNEDWKSVNFYPLETSRIGYDHSVYLSGPSSRITAAALHHCVSMLILIKNTKIAELHPKPEAHEEYKLTHYLGR